MSDYLAIVFLFISIMHLYFLHRPSPLFRDSSFVCEACSVKQCLNCCIFLCSFTRNKSSWKWESVSFLLSLYFLDKLISVIIKSSVYKFVHLFSVILQHCLQPVISPAYLCTRDSIYSAYKVTFWKAAKSYWLWIILKEILVDINTTKHNFVLLIRPYHYPVLKILFLCV